MMPDYTSVKTKLNKNGKLIYCYTYSKEKNQRYRRNSCIPMKLQQAKRNAKRKNISFTITTEYMKNLLEEQNNRCAYSNQVLGTIGDGYLSPSIDRIDSTKGYEPGNVQWLSWRVNEMKKDMLEDDFILLCKQIAERATTISKESTLQTIGSGSGEPLETK